MTIQKTELPNVFLLSFNPSNWSFLHRLHAFLGPPLSSDANVRIGLRDCEGHLAKVAICWRIARRLRPNLFLDREELEKYGGSDDLHSKEFAVVCESVIAGLYSAIDGLRTFLFGAYRKVSRVQKGSNRQLFERAANNQYGIGFPEPIRLKLAEAWEDWFPPLRKLRTQLTHGSAGTCHLDKAGRIVYLNEGMGERAEHTFLQDVETYLKQTERSVRELIEDVCAFHYSKLQAIPRFTICGWYHARWYARMVSPNAELSWDHGHCLSYEWFEREHEHFCPMANQCEAYKRKWPGGLAGAMAPDTRRAM